MEELGERINFYERKESFYEFSNFFLKPVDVRKKEWPTTEHFFQAMKFEGNQKKRRFGVQPNQEMHSDWEEVFQGEERTGRK